MGLPLNDSEREAEERHRAERIAALRALLPGDPSALVDEKPA